jgi:hypothetical protein
MHDVPTLAHRICLSGRIIGDLRRCGYTREQNNSFSHSWDFFIFTIAHRRMGLLTKLIQRLEQEGLDIDPKIEL